MKTLWAMIILSMFSILHADEFSPHVKIKTQGSGYISWTSGTVIKSGETTEIITCAHNTIDREYLTECTVYLFGEHKSAKADFKIAKKCYERDLILLISNESYPVRQIKLSDKRLPQETNGVGYGYTGLSFELKENKTSNFDYKNYTHIRKFPILTVDGKVLNSMSGGGLFVDEEFVGVQNAGANNKISYTPGFQVIEFINE